MIVVKPRYRVRIENALDICGVCAVESEIEATSIQELLDNVEAFMNSIGLQSSEISIERLDMRADGSIERAIYLFGLHWRIEAIDRVETIAEYAGHCFPVSDGDR